MKALIHSKALDVWSDEWNNNLMTKYNHRQTKNWREKPDGKAARELVQNNSRVTFSQKVGIITGHANFGYHESIISKGEESAICNQCEGDYTQDSEHIMRFCTKYWAEREIIFGNELPDLRQISDSQLTRYIQETDFPWFPPKEGENVEEEEVQQTVPANIMANNREPAPQEQDSEIESNSDASENPGYELFDPDSDDEQEATPDADTHNNETINELDNFLISPNDNPLPLLSNRGSLDPASNWLQSSSDNESDIDHNQFLL